MLRWAHEHWLFKRAADEAIATALRDDGMRTRDVVLVPCWRRPEMLWHCLDNLCRADGIEQLHVIFRADSGHDPDNLAVIHSFAHLLGSFEVQSAPVCPYQRTRLSANILLGYLYAAAAARRWVFLVEEDIMVARDFFRWHQSVHARRANLFCSIGVRNHNRPALPPADPAGYYLSHADYCSWGVCFDRSVLLQRLPEHVATAYFSHPKRYLRRHFASSSVALAYVEQAGLIRRLQESSMQPIAYPAVPRAFHAGFYGRNRAGALSGSLGERVLRLQGLIYDRAAMRGLALTEQYARDSEPVRLDIDVAGRVPLRQLSVPWRPV